MKKSINKGIAIRIGNALKKKLAEFDEKHKTEIINIAIVEFKNIAVSTVTGAMTDDEIIDKVGSGGMSDVYKARCHKLNRFVAIKVLRQVGLSSDIADLYPSELSGGMQKRVGLARAVVTKPEIIFFDEPTTGLDPIMADVINDLIIESAKDLGATTLTITHDMVSARKIADKIAMLYQGKIVWYGTVKELDKTNNPYVKQFINGSSKGPIVVEK